MDDVSDSRNIRILYWKQKESENKGECVVKMMDLVFIIKQIKKP